MSVLYSGLFYVVLHAGEINLGNMICNLERVTPPLFYFCSLVDLIAAMRFRMG